MSGAEAYMVLDRAGHGIQLELVGPIVCALGHMTADDLATARTEITAGGFTYMPTVVGAWGQRPT